MIGPRMYTLSGCAFVALLIINAKLIELGYYG